MLDRIKKNYYLLIITFLFIYFFLNFLDGNRGWLSNLEKQDIYNELKLKENDLKIKIRHLEHRNSLLTDNLDLDFIEILIREKFLFGKSGETTYIINNDNKQN